MKERFRFDPYASFIELAIVRWTVGVFLLFAGVAALVITFATDLEPDFSSDGFNHFLVVYRFPLGLLALAIPVVALLAANHRSVQTSAQISAATEQNKFSNYYRHLEEFEKYASRQIGDKILKLVNVRKVHDALFPHAMRGDYRVNPDFVGQLEAACKGIVHATGLLGAGMNRNDRVLYSIHRTFITTLRVPGLEFVSPSGIQIEMEQGQFFMPKTVRAYFENVRDRVELLTAILEFDRDFDVPPSAGRVRDLDLSKVPDHRTVNADMLESVPQFDPY